MDKCPKKQSGVETMSSEGTKKRILEAATAEFAEHGIAGARVDRIADSARINKQRVYAYFGTKDGLFEAVLLDAFASIARALPPLESVEALPEYAVRIYDYHRNNPHFARLIAWEAFTFEDREVPGEEQRMAYYQAKLAPLTDGIPGADRRQAACMLLQVITIAVWPPLMQPLVRHLFSLPPGVSPDCEALRESVRVSARVIVDTYRRGVDTPAL